MRLTVHDKDEVPLLQPVQEGTATDAGPSYNSKITMDVPKGHSQSVDQTDHDRDREREEKGLSAILSRLQLGIFYDKTFAKAVRHALRRMYHVESIRVKGETIPREDVRGVMELLTIDHIDFVERQLKEATSAVTCGEKYLIACLYNAPATAWPKFAAGKGFLRS